MGRAVGLQSTYLHLSKTLSAELGFSSQGLLGYQRVGARGTGMDLIVYQMMQLQVMHVTCLLYTSRAF